MDPTHTRIGLVSISISGASLIHTPFKRTAQNRVEEVDERVNFVHLGMFARWHTRLKLHERLEIHELASKKQMLAYLLVPLVKCIAGSKFTSLAINE